MASEPAVIDRIRRLVADYQPCQQYDDEVYRDQIQFALEKLSFDFDVDYLAVTDVPVRHTFLLVKLATINMCYVRASEGAEGGSGEGEETRFTNIAVPDLTVSDGNADDSRGPSFWLKLAQRLQEEYDNELGDSGPAGQNVGGVVVIDYSRRISLTHGGYRKRVLDPGLEAVVVEDPPTVDGSSVELRWTTLAVEGFSYYEIVRAPTSAFNPSDTTVALQEADIHVGEGTELNVPSGTWYYRVRTVNPNGLKTDSNTVSAVVG